MKLIKTFEAYGQIDPKENKQFRLVTKNKSRTNVVLPTEHFTNTWDGNLTDYDGVKLRDFLKDSHPNDVWETNSSKITCVADDYTPIDKADINNDKKFLVSFPDSKKGDFTLRMPYINKTGDINAVGHDGSRLADFVLKSDVGDTWEADDRIIKCISK